MVNFTAKLFGVYCFELNAKKSVLGFNINAILCNLLSFHYLLLDLLNPILEIETPTHTH